MLKSPPHQAKSKLNPYSENHAVCEHILEVRLVGDFNIFNLSGQLPGLFPALPG